jgi:PKHD-type hydroxylase
MMQNKPDFYHIPTAINRDVVEVILNQYKKVSLDQSRILIEKNNGIDLKIRNSKQCWINTDNWISGMMKHFVEVANNNFFNYNLTQWSGKIQYTVYDEKKSHYAWHSDITESTHDPNIVRKLSISLLLSDPNEYEGGVFQIMHLGDKKMTNMKPPIGTAIIFPSTTRHRVRPVKSGKRISLVGWYGGPPFR